MFKRKSKLNSNLPEPPTKAEILEDLETFSLDLMNRTRHSISSRILSTSVSSLDPVDSPKTPNRKTKEPETDRQLEEWWDTKFEKFLSDIDKLEIYQKQFAKKKTNLAKLDETIGLMADDIHTRITDSLEKAQAEIPEAEQDLK